MAKVLVKDKPVGFVPKVVEIHFESADEYNAFVQMARTNVSVPQSVYQYDIEARRILKKVLDAINDVT